MYVDSTRSVYVHVKFHPQGLDCMQKKIKYKFTEEDNLMSITAYQLKWYVDK